MLRKISIALVVASLVLTSAGLSQAQPSAGRPVQAHPGFAVRPGVPANRGFAFRPGFVPGRHFHRGGVFVGVTPFVVGGAIAYGAAPYYYDPGYAYSAPAPSYWYYCQSYGAYYPDVPSCPEAWVPVPAQ